jgi:hypothetical protein
VARALADTGAIHYTRGRITILDRALLLSHACHCYQVLRDATERTLTGSAPSTA